MHLRALNPTRRVSARGGHRQLQWVGPANGLKPRLEGGKRGSGVRERQLVSGGEVSADRARIATRGVAKVSKRVVAPSGHSRVFAAELFGAASRQRERVTRLLPSVQQLADAVDCDALACRQRLAAPPHLRGIGRRERLCQRGGNTGAVAAVGGLAPEGGELGRRASLLGLSRVDPVAQLVDAVVQSLDGCLRLGAPLARLLGLLGGPAQLPRAARRGVVLERLAPGVKARALRSKRVQRLPRVREFGLRTRVLLLGLAELPAHTVKRGLCLADRAGPATGRHPRVGTVRRHVPLRCVARLDHRRELLGVLLERAKRLGYIGDERLIERR